MVEVEGTWAGSEGHGTVGCAAVVDAAIDVIVGRGVACPTDREASRMWPDRWPVVVGHAMTFTFECPKMWLSGRRWRTKRSRGSWRWVQNNPTKHDRVKGKRSKFCLCLLFYNTYYIVHVFSSSSILISIERQPNIKRRQQGYENFGSGHS